MVGRLGFTVKKKTIRATEHDRADVAAARQQWRTTAPRFDPTRLVFLDESGIATDLIRRYGRSRRPRATPVPLTWASVPEDYDVQLKALRRHLDISQAGFARLVGAAGKAVVYQWEARKRTPSPLFWQRVHELQSGVRPHPVP